MSPQGLGNLLFTSRKLVHSFSWGISSAWLLKGANSNKSGKKSQLLKDTHIQIHTHTHAPARPGSQHSPSTPWLPSWARSCFASTRKNGSISTCLSWSVCKRMQREEMNKRKTLSPHPKNNTRGWSLVDTWIWGQGVYNTVYKMWGGIKKTCLGKIKVARSLLTGNQIKWIILWNRK